MIRTETVNLTVIPAIAYRQKLPAGGSGIVILFSECPQPGIASISKTSGQAIPAKNNPSGVYPKEAFNEAITLTARLPYLKRSAPEVPKVKVEEPEATPEEEALEVVVDSSDYQKIVDAYTDKNGKLSFDLLNKDLIKFAHTSKVARDMIADKATAKSIANYVVASKFRNVSGNKKLTDEQALKIAELLDAASPKSVVKELNAEIRRKLKG